MASSKSIICSINAIFMALFPILDIYPFQSLPIGIGSILLLMSGFLSMFLTKPNIITKDAVLWIISLIVISLFTYMVQGSETWFSSSLYWHNLIVTAYILFIIITSGCRIDIQVFFKTCVIVGAVASIICVYQRYTLLITGAFNMFYIPGLNLGEEVGEQVLTLKRPAAFFTEPAHLCIYIVPMFYYLLINNKIILTIVFAAGILASGSTTGFLLLGLLLFLFILSKGSKKRKVLYSILFVVTALVVIRYAPSVMQENVDKFNETDVSESIRLFGGVLIWRFFSMTDVIFGIGLNQLENFAMSHSLLLKNYSGALIYIFTCYGLLGIGATIWFIVSLLKKPNANYGGLIIFLGIFCTDQILFNRNLVFLLVFVELMRMWNAEQSLQKIK